MDLNPSEYATIPEQIPTKPTVDIDFSSLQERGQIGSGGTADVTKMEDPQSDTVIAIKQPRVQGTLDERILQTVVSEAETWEKLDDHDGIVGVIDWDTTPVPWIALEYMDSRDLTDRIGNTGIGESLWIGARVADAVRNAHRHGVAHLDLKPANILFRTTTPRTWDVPKVSDWGLAKQLLHHSREVDGLSPRYSAPEQFDPETLGSPDERTDIYQLGTVIYELLTGDPPFSGSPKTMMDRHLTDAPEKPTAIDPTLPAAVDGVLGTALATHKDDRYESMLDFRRDLTSLFRAVALDESVSLICSPEDEYTTSVGGSSKTRSGHADFTDGSNFGSDPSDPGVLNTIREQSQTSNSQEFPWQRRTRAPGLEGETAGTLKREYVSDETTGVQRSQTTKSTISANDPDSSNRSSLELLSSLLKQLFG
ncbi:serine/threonine-protein kinase [Halorhabdus amylolytica]|uniref:serine/threonine-protein kinase n=1 Tax=Halorhabdus amylolytica TaxID=2559573 RepID=UPI0010A9F50D|nr:serine/threonine-protein kinase [Halorhabdus amylolytica]